MTENDTEQDGVSRTRKCVDVKFDHPNVGYVLDGLEDATVRYGFEHNLQEGDHLRLLTPGGHCFALARVEDVYQAPARLVYFDMAVTDGRNHPSGNAFDLLRRMNGHYEDEIVPETLLTVIYFDLIHVVMGERNNWERDTENQS